MIRLAVIGAVKIDPYRRVIPRLPEATWVEVLDETRAAVPSGASRMSATTESLRIQLRQFDEWLLAERDSMDALLIHGDTILRAEIARRAAAAGKHVLVQSPLAHSVAEADQVIDACRAAGVCLMVGQPPRFTPSTQAIKHSLAARQLGEPGLLRIHHWESCPGGDGIELHGPPAGSAAGERLIAAVPDRLVEDLDVANWLFESLPTEVYAVCRRAANRELDVPDYVQVHLGFPGGGMALIDYARTLPSGRDYRSLSLIGSTGAAYADDHHDVHLAYRGGEPVAVRADCGDAALRSQLAEFLSAIDDRRPPSSAGADGRAALQVAAAVVQSINQSKTAHLREGQYAAV